MGTAVQAADGALAVRLGLDALDAASSDDDRALAHGWLSLALALRDDAPAATAHAEQALRLGRPLGLSLTRQLLEIAGRTPDPASALQAAERQLAIARRIAQRYGETPQSLRDLSISLDNVAAINETRGQLDPALAAYQEALAVYQRLADAFDPVFTQPEELERLRASVARVSAAVSDGR